MQRFQFVFLAVVVVGCSKIADLPVTREKAPQPVSVITISCAAESALAAEIDARDCLNSALRGKPASFSPSSDHSRNDFENFPELTWHSQNCAA